MEAGYDYLLVNRRFGIVQRIFRSIGENPLPYAGAALVVLGLIGVLIGSLFFFVFDKSTEDLENELVASVQTTPQPSGELSQARRETPTPPPATAAPLEPAAPRPTQPPVTELSADLARQAGLYPGENLKAAYWSEPIDFQPTLPLGDWLDGFTPLSPSEVAAVGQLPIPTRLIIPSIDVESDVKQLSILNLGNSRAYETPDNVVGHIPASANPGEAGSTWLFGHLESPIRGEGNVFAQLPEIPSMLRRGDDVYAVVENGSEQYLYRIVESKVVPQDQLSLTDDGSPQLLMVTCVPRFVYDHRLIVRGVLEGVKS